ncbi:10436_t:CDS:2 [Funneliformis caledonium]|uniref:10436_t:CDS:1 n=1 Tax=Funneliformis caledonium TaxID=1117310 RepID=A0A9N9BKE9_9GLOM|nr:10436_t:CDS:2 [Funneliformis caledonium]
MPTGGIPKIVLKEVRYREERSVLCTPRHAPLCATSLTAGVEEEECLVFTSLQRSVLLYSSTPCRGPGKEIGVNWEYHLKIPGNGGCGSFRSDSAAIIFNGANQQFPFFITEFENDGFAVHKDAVVVVEETAFEYNRMLTVAYYLSEDECLIYAYEGNGVTFKLHTGDQEADVASVLNDSTRPSSADLSASIDTKGSRYATPIRTCGRKPESIYLYREGISNNQFKTVLELEISEIKVPPVYYAHIACSRARFYSWRESWSYHDPGEFVITYGIC